MTLSNARTFFTGVLAFLLVGSAAAVKDDPLELNKGLIEAFKSVSTASDSKKLSQADTQENAKTYKRLDGFFDWEYLLGKPIEPHRDKFSPTQVERCKLVFKQLVRIIAYPDSGEFFREAKYSLKQPVIKGDHADVEMDGKLEKEDFEITVTFHWRRAGSTWKIADVSFDGASLIKDYQNQFGRIVDKEGAEGLIKRMEERLKEEEGKRGKLP